MVGGISGDREASMRKFTLTSIKVTNVEQICMATEGVEEDGSNLKEGMAR